MVLNIISCHKLEQTVNMLRVSLRDAELRAAQSKADADAAVERASVLDIKGQELLRYAYPSKRVIPWSFSRFENKCHIRSSCTLFLDAFCFHRIPTFMLNVCPVTSRNHRVSWNLRLKAKRRLRHLTLCAWVWSTYCALLIMHYTCLNSACHDEIDICIWIFYPYLSCFLSRRRHRKHQPSFQRRWIGPCSSLPSALERLSKQNWGRRLLKTTATKFLTGKPSKSLALFLHYLCVLVYMILWFVFLPS